MKKVKFIRSLNIEDVPCADRHYFEYHQLASVNFVEIEGSESILLSKEPSDCHSVSIQKINKATTASDLLNPEIEETYIAYSKEVQEFLEMPFDLLQEQLYTAQKRCNKYQSEVYYLRETLEEYKEASFKKRLKFLFKRCIK